MNCSTGKHSASTGSSICDSCAEGYFASDKGMVSCEKCASESQYGSDYTSAEGSPTCNLCVRESYMDDGECFEKPEGVIRTHAGTTLESMSLERGWYRSVSQSGSGMRRVVPSAQPAQRPRRISQPQSLHRLTNPPTPRNPRSAIPGQVRAQCRRRVPVSVDPQLPWRQDSFKRINGHVAVPRRELRVRA